MGRTTAAITNYLNLIFCNIAWPNVGDASGLQPSAAAGNWVLSLHTADPGQGGNQSTNEAAWGGYTRILVPRDTSNWLVAAPQVSNILQLLFPVCTSGSEVDTHWGLGTDSSGAGHLEYSGVIGGAFSGFTAEVGTSIVVPGHSLIVNDPVAFYDVCPDWAFPTGLTVGTVYYVKTVSGDTITVSTTVGGSAVSVTVAGSGMCSKAAPITVSVNKQPTIEASALVIIEH